MNNLIVKSLMIFEPQNKLAKRIEFEEGINVITSDGIEGNDVGKSILLKSIYHTLGADSIFDDKWKETLKIYVLQIILEKSEYYICRTDKMFKIFSSEYKMIFNTANRNELSIFLNQLYDFGVKLPNKETDEFEIATPVYSYLLNYIDQDKMEGPKFSSFSNLYQYKNDKEKILYNHFGIFTDEYFKTIEKIEELKRVERNLNDEQRVIDSMIHRVKGYLKGKDAPINIESLKVELEKNKNEYTSLVMKLNKAKNDLIKLRNEQINLENDIKELQRFKRQKENDVEVINENICPTCSQQTDDIGLKITQNSQLEDFYIMKIQLDSFLLEVNKKVAQNEKHYEDLLERFTQFEEEMNDNNRQISDVLKHRGYIETLNNMLRESGVVQASKKENEEDLKANKKILTQYNNLKKEANLLYEQYMIESVNMLGIKEISVEKFNKINNNFISRGSNIPTSTIIWFFNLLKVKFILNPNALRFPLVLDSPNNVELDDNKRKALFNYIFMNKDENTQLIVSTLGFNINDYRNIHFDNIIHLNNNKYELLNKEDYEWNKGMLDIIFYGD